MNLRPLGGAPPPVAAARGCSAARATCLYELAVRDPGSVEINPSDRSDTEKMIRFAAAVEAVVHERLRRRLAFGGVAAACLRGSIPPSSRGRTSENLTKPPIPYSLVAERLGVEGRRPSRRFPAEANAHTLGYGDARLLERCRIVPFPDRSDSSGRRPRCLRSGFPQCPATPPSIPGNCGSSGSGPFLFT